MSVSHRPLPVRLSDLHGDARLAALHARAARATAEWRRREARARQFGIFARLLPPGW
ncbi:hypothetical protein NPJ82_10535 [Sphingomonas sp. NY01]|uniref:hypothetical protein n=1 Tax=Sphingomonas sp. NY01 TaxID=2968057 RepID=UPI00315CADC9